MKIYISKNNYYYKILNNHKKIRISKTEFNKLQQKGAGASFSKGTSDQNSPKTYQHNELTKMKKYVDDEIQKLENQIKIKEDKLLETKIRLTARSRYGYRREINPEYPNTKPLRKKLEKEISLLTEELNFLNEKRNHLKIASFKINQADELKTVEKVLKDGLGETIAKNLGSEFIGERIRLGMGKKLYKEANIKNRPKKTNKRPRNNNNNKNNIVKPVSQRSKVNNGSQR
jgi:hypothetical protein